MERSKVKNFILVVLLLVNLVFVLLLVLDGREAAAVRSQMREELTALLEARGIAVAEDAELIQEAPAGLVLYRDLEAEKELVEAVLGVCSVSPQGGNIYIYTGEKGQATLSGTGAVDMLLDSDEYAVKKDVASLCEALLEKLGAEADPGLTEISGEAGVTYVTMTCRRDEATVYNCRVTFTFTGDYLRLVSGLRLFDDAGEEAEKGTVDSATAVMRFLESAQPCARLEALEPGYAVSFSVSGECALSPVWRLVTDAGTFYVNAVTGRLQAI